MKTNTRFYTEKRNIISMLFFLILISSSVSAQIISTWGTLSGTLPENDFQTSSLSANADGTSLITVDITQSGSATVSEEINAVPPGLILGNSFNNSRATIGVSGNTYTYTFSEPVQVILSSQEHSEFIRTENIKISSPDTGVLFSGSITGGQIGHFVSNNNTSQIHIGSNSTITTAGTYWTVESNIALTTLSVEYYVADPVEVVSGEPFTLDLAPNPWVRLDTTNSTGAGGIDFNATICTSGAKPFEGSDIILNAPHGIERIEVNLTNIQDTGFEELSIPADFQDIQIAGNGTSTLIATNINSATTSDFQDIISELYYINKATNPNTTIARAIEITVFDAYGSSSIAAMGNLNLVPASNSGKASGPFVVLSTDASTDLVNALDGSQDAGGTWVDVDGTAALTGSIVDITTLTIGSYEFRYEVTGTTPCSASSTKIVLIIVDAIELEITSPSSCGFILTEYTDATFSAGSNDPIYIFDTPGNNGELSCPTTAGAIYHWYLFDEPTNSYLPFALNTTPTQTNLADGGYLVIRDDAGTITEGRAWIWNSSLTADAGTSQTVCNGNAISLIGSGTELNLSYTYYDPVNTPTIITSATIFSVTFDITHTHISDIGYFLVSPDNMVTIPLGLSERLNPCYGANNAQNLVFTNDTSITPTSPVFDVCKFSRDNGCSGLGPALTGTYNAYYTNPSNNNTVCGVFSAPTGATAINVSSIAGYDFEQGGWKVQVTDCAFLDAGEISSVTITFDDKAGTIVTYSSGAVNVPIIDEACDLNSATIYELPFTPPPPPLGAIENTITINLQNNIGIGNTGGYEWSYSTTGSTGPWSGPFENGTITPSVSPTSTTWYRIQMDNGVGCSAEDVVQITVIDKPNSGTETDLYACTGGTVINLNDLLSGEETGSWSISALSLNNPGSDFNSGMGTYDPSTEGVYTFDYTVNPIAPCVVNSTTSVTVSVQTERSAGNNNTINTNNPDIVIDLFSSLLGAPDTGGIWSLDTTGSIPGTNFDSSAGTLDTSGLVAGAYSFDYMITSCTTDISTVTVLINFPSVDIITPIEGDDIVNDIEDKDVTITGTTISVEEGQMVTVTFSDGTNSVTTTAIVESDGSWIATDVDISGFVEGSIIIDVEVTDIAGNQANDQETIVLDNIAPTISKTSIAQAMTPNNDGINDTWVIKDIEEFPNSVVKVYNRWGKEVFAKQGYQNDWNGVYKSKSDQLPQGSYYFIVDLKNGVKPLDGWLYINY
ncbi:gliding motility-associated C-terminal domain-containing protein [Aquimarina algiphila]|uniref:T9SS type B sorting domain-containing protein n=1 Tax=Aquimarina algiphila TaxID=2047982 RepID=UPI00232C30AF|nr:gliding motility-associated C-terminal domain-containing protein [Aquimarina algiphila]